MYNNWSFVPILLKIGRALIRWTPWRFLGGGGGDESPLWGHSSRVRSGGSGDEGCLPNYFGWEFIVSIKTHFYGGALTSHFMEEHSSPTYIFPFFMMTSSNGNMFRVTGFCAGNLPVTAGIHRSLNTLRQKQDGRRFCSRHFHMHFLEWNFWILIKISLKYVPYGLVGNKPSLSGTCLVTTHYLNHIRHKPLHKVPLSNWKKLQNN